MGIFDKWIMGTGAGLGYQLGQSIKEKKEQKYKSILVNSDEAINRLKEIRGQKDEVLRQKGLLEQLSVQTEGCWAGQSGDALRTVIANAIAEQASIAADLEENATLMMQAIQSLIDTDEEIAEMIRQDKPGHGGYGSSGRGGSGGGRRG